ncbi:(2Fe-2S)-binding protein [Tatumella citrea]|uniref:(2Fe-2S)-binding protein n=1 Tax=Tatumella citrea TaxID=53336 RepID=A0A1Y0LFN7_TATCI|nr:(2Fe-2S)-binding protein [Tatumella citrea]ARU92836.1 (2Fe-2S)-binding protein [Tatumella citrea]ARU96874.1 (2Fe-2S)-binding protein [Tatumella citrea]
MPQLFIDGQQVTLAEGATVAAALSMVGDHCSRTSVSGSRRAPVCGMGICQECRVMINGQRRLACQTLCQEAMEVVTYE